METKLIIIRSLIVFIFSLLYGLQRQRSHKPVGFGTFIYVAIGSCALTIASMELGFNGGGLPLLSAIVTGIGFLGAGALIRNSDRVFGFTTAAGIWLFAIFGMLIGLGHYLNAGVVYSMIWIVVFLDTYLERKGLGSYRRKLAIGTNFLVDKKEIMKVLSKHCNNFHLIDFDINKRARLWKFSYLIEGPIDHIAQLIRELDSKKWCVSVKFE